MITREQFLEKYKALDNYADYESIVSTIESYPFLNLKFVDISENVDSSTNLKISSQSDLSREILQSTIRKVLQTLFKDRESIDTTNFLKENPEVNPMFHGRDLFRHINDKHEIFNAENTIISNGLIGAALKDFAGFTDYLDSNIEKRDIGYTALLFPIGTIGKASLYVDPFMKYNDCRFIVFNCNTINLKLRDLTITSPAEISYSLEVNPEGILVFECSSETQALLY